MDKKIYNQPVMKCKAPWAQMPIAQMPVGSDEHEDQWSKERDRDFDNECMGTDQDTYGNLW